MENVRILVESGRSQNDYPVEIVERKGIGHPDSLADGISEEIAKHICSLADASGKIPYHYSDKVTLRGGQAEPKFGGGRIIEPYEVCATYVGDGSLSEVTAVELVENYLRKTIKHFEKSHAKITAKMILPSEHSLLTYNEDPFWMEDTSVGASYAPLSKTEKLTLQLENLLNSKGVKDKHPMIGEDVKVMTIRDQKTIDLTIACGFIDRYLQNMNDYLEAKSIVEMIVREFLNNHEYSIKRIRVNAADHPELDLVYLTVSGTSIEQGDCGFTGRGNRIRGVISPMRAMTMEAAAGKSIVNHSGKLYSLLAQEIATEIVEHLGAEDAQVEIVGAVGDHANSPCICYAKVFSDKPIKAEVEKITAKWLNNIDEVRKRYLNNRLTVF